MVVVAYFGDDDWSVPAFQRLLDTPDVHVAAVVQRRKPSSPSLAALAHEAQLPVLCPYDVNAADFIDDYRTAGIELGISNSYDQIFRSPFITAHRLGLINCHTSLLPRYRGRNALTWAMIAGESHVGVTVHQIDDGVDTGDILVQVAVPVGPNDRFGVVRERVGQAGAVAIAEAVRGITTGSTVPIKQSSLSPGFYVSRRGPGDEVIDWGSTANCVHDFVRAMAPPGPGARTVGPDMKSWSIERTEHVAQHECFVGRPGTVLAHRDNHFVVKCADTAITVVEYQRGSSGERPRRPPVGYRFTA